jgi:hypothetical protein
MPTRRLIVTLLVAVTIVAIAFVVRARASQRRAHSQICAGRLFPFTFVAWQWMHDAETNRFPTTLMYLSNDVPLRWLICPSDRSRRCATNWSAFTLENSSYELVSPGIAPSDTNSVFLRCRVHGHYPTLT